jgi:hypothetical protein
MRFYYRTGERSAVSVGWFGALVLVSLALAAIGTLTKTGEGVALLIAFGLAFMYARWARPRGAPTWPAWVLVLGTMVGDAIAHNFGAAVVIIGAIGISTVLALVIALPIIAAMRRVRRPRTPEPERDPFGNP